MKYKISKTIDPDHYISGFSAEMQRLLLQVRTTIIKAAPDAEEVMRYQMPAYKYHGMLVYFAGYKNNIGFYPMISDTVMFKEELAIFNKSKGAIQFRLDIPLPLQLISRIVTFRMKENLTKEMLKATHQRITSLNNLSLRRS
jgi:uncharacterized protein YdhG (YjbR/CyaY superfamily)